MRVLSTIGLTLCLAAFVLAVEAEAAPDEPQVVPAAGTTVVTPASVSAPRTHTPYPRTRSCTPYPYYRPYYRQRWYYCRTPYFYRPYPYRHAPRVYAHYGYRYWRDYHGGPAGRAARYRCVSR